MDYQVKNLGRTCAATGNPLEPGSVCYCVLVERDGQQLRLDYSAEGWTGPPDDCVGEWVTRVPDNTGGRRVVDVEALFRYFEQLTEDANPARDRFRYVLALQLLQKRRLRLEGTRRDDEGNDFLQLIGSRSEGPFEVPDEALPEDEINRIQAALTTEMEADEFDATA